MLFSIMKFNLPFCPHRVLMAYKITLTSRYESPTALPIHPTDVSLFSSALVTESDAPAGN